MYLVAGNRAIPVPAHGILSATQRGEVVARLFVPGASFGQSDAASMLVENKILDCLRIGEDNGPCSVKTTKGQL